MGRKQVADVVRDGPRRQNFGRRRRSGCGGCFAVFFAFGRVRRFLAKRRLGVFFALEAFAAPQFDLELLLHLGALLLRLGLRRIGGGRLGRRLSGARFAALLTRDGRHVFAQLLQVPSQLFLASFERLFLFGDELLSSAASAAILRL